jgi:hypothetical protein
MRPADTALVSLPPHCAHLKRTDDNAVAPWRIDALQEH